MFILALAVSAVTYLTNALLESWHENLITWWLAECLIVIAGLALKVLLHMLIAKWLPLWLVDFLPVLIFLLGVVILLMYVLKLFFPAVAFFTCAPLMWIYDFIGSTTPGKVIKTAFFTAFALGVLAIVLSFSNVGVPLAIGAAGIYAFLPMIVMLMILSFLLFKFL